MTDLTAALARFASQPPFTHVPGDLIGIVRNGFIDTVATLIAGRDEPVVRILLEHLSPFVQTHGEASVLLGARRAYGVHAALINGTAAHALDYDDVALNGHPSTVLVPALLAEGEVTGASGADLLRAYLVGYEVWAELIGRDQDAHHMKGWHPTAVFGSVAAAAAVSNLRRLSVETARHAIALSASMAGGLAANFGSMTKPYHAGRAASAGVEATRLATLGMTASPDAIEHHAGFMQAFSPKGRVDLTRSMDHLGVDLHMRRSRLNIKKYPMCYATHRVIDGVLDLVKREGVDVDQVESVLAKVGPTQAAMLRNHAPRTGLEAKFSLEFAVASSLIAGATGRAQLTDDFVCRPDVQSTMTKVVTESVDTVCPIEPFLALTDRVTIKLKNGRELDTGEIRFARGSANLPLDEADLKRKFDDCTQDARDLPAQALYQRLLDFASLPNVRGLTAMHR